MSSKIYYCAFVTTCYCHDYSR